MTVIEILEMLLIGPLKLVFEVIFNVANRFVGHPGLAIIFLSLVMNILVLPLYKRADAVQEENRNVEAKLQARLAHIKKVFTGDERMMMTQTYYRQNNYKPTDALNGSVSLLLEVPFFMAAYQFLSNLKLLEGISLGPIVDLGAPDGMLVIGGIAINLLPVLMTLVNVISSALYLKGFPLKTKIQLYGMAAFFLVFLYTSPSGLVFYWTLNNVFSLVKTIFYKLKNPKKVLSVMTAVLGVLLLVFTGFVYEASPMKKALLYIIGAALLLPAVVAIVKSRLNIREKEQKEITPNKKLFIAGSVTLTVLVGMLIPSVFISASPQEFVDINNYLNPNWYVLSATCLAAGTFLVWLRVFYWLANPKGKAIFDKLVWCLCGVMLVNYMFFGTKLGIISSALQYETGLVFGKTELVVNLFVVAIVVVGLYFVAKKWQKLPVTALLVVAVALGGMSVVNMVKTQNAVENLSQQAESVTDTPSFSLSKNGKNVIVIMLDRAMGEYVPYMFNEKPELKEQFDGFTYYDNTISYGVATNFGTPALFGGYEYTPVELNKRAEELLKDKHNEALKVMPVLFAQNGYDVTVIDPPYANYQWIPDLSIYDQYPEIQTYLSKGKFSSVEQKQATVGQNKRNFFCFSLMKTLPVCLQALVYDNGGYHQVSSEVVYSSQITHNISQSTGIDANFMNAYNVLTSMSDITKITEEQTNTFQMMSNDTPHMFTLLQAGDYTPALQVDNTRYDAKNADRFEVDGKTLKVESAFQMAHYHVNMATMLRLGEWFDYLREQGVYDNTKIILVSDHGYPHGQTEELWMELPNRNVDVSGYFPLLMVKDFGAEGFTTDHTFMTNADVPTLAVKDLIENPVNPFTNKVITDTEKTAHDQFITASFQSDVNVNNGTTFEASAWLSVKDDIWNKNNWTYIGGEVTLSEHVAP